MRGSPLIHRPPAEVGLFPKLEWALLSFLRFPFPRGLMTHGLRADMAWAKFLEARAARATVRYSHYRVLLTPLTRRGTRNADIPPLEMCAHHIAGISPHLVSPAISQKTKKG